MMYVLTAKHFGRPAGLIAALVFALTPVVTAAARNNTMDMQLVLVLEVAAWYLFKSIETSRWRYLFVCAVFIGLGFNIKMLQAYMVLPAVVIVYLVFAKEKFLKRLAAGAVSVVILAAVSFAWVLAVDLTSPSERPYVGSSTDNTVIELIIGHNGMERLYGRTGLRNTGAGGGQLRPDGADQNGGPSAGGFNKPDGGPDGGGGTFNRPDGGPLTGAPGDDAGAGGVGLNEIGSAGALRLWNQNLYGQASWLILLALFCIAAKLGRFRLKELSLRQGVLIFWIVWLVTMVLFFSFAGFFHRYYLCMMAPGIAALCGIGIPEMVRAFREKRGWKQALLPLSLLGTVAVELLFVWRYEALRAWLVPVMLVPAAAALVLMALHYMRPKERIPALAAGLTLLSLLAAPFTWSLTVVLYGGAECGAPLRRSGAGVFLSHGGRVPGPGAANGGRRRDEGPGDVSGGQLQGGDVSRRGAARQRCGGADCGHRPAGGGVRRLHGDGQRHHPGAVQGACRGGKDHLFPHVRPGRRQFGNHRLRPTERNGCQPVGISRNHGVPGRRRCRGQPWQNAVHVLLKTKQRKSGDFRCSAERRI